MPNIGSPLTGGAYAWQYADHGQGGLHSVADDTTMLATATYLLEGGMLFFVAASANNEGLPTYYQLNAGYHNPLVIGDFSQFGNSSVNPAWATQTSWFIDPVGGNDLNTGLTSGTGLKTWAEFRRRMLAVGGHKALALVTITLMSSLPDSDVMTIDWNSQAPALVDDERQNVLITGVTTLISSGVVSGFSVRVPASNLPNILTNSSLTDWSGARPEDGRVLTFTSGAANGCYCWMAKDIGAGVGWVSSIANPYSAGQLVEYNPAPGDTYQVLQLPHVKNYNISPTFGDNFRFNKIDFGDYGGSVDSWVSWLGGSGTPRMQFDTCGVIPNFDTGNIDYEGSFVKYYISGYNAATISLGGCLVKTIYGAGMGEIEDAADLTLEWGTLFIGVFVTVIDNGYVRCDDVGVFDCPGSGMGARDGRARLNVLWGSGNGDYGFVQAQGVKTEYTFGTTITGTLGDVEFCGAVLTWAQVQAAIKLVSATSDSTMSPNGDTAGKYLTAVNRGTIVANGATPVAQAYAPINASSVVMFSMASPAGTPAAMPYATITAGTGFSIHSYFGDTSTYNWIVL